MDKELQKKKLDAAREECEKYLKSWVKSETGRCDSVWDGVLCWDEAPANTIRYLPCPDYIHGFDTHQNASRYCDANGTWFVHPQTGLGWSNYMGCVSKGDVNATTQSPAVSADAMLEAREHGERLILISSIGYGISLFSLIIAVFIICCSRKLKSKTNILHLNLFLAFILRAGLSFLVRLLFVDGLGLEKDLVKDDQGNYKFNEEGSHWECKLLQTVFLYAICVSQMWIFVEGLYLHMLIYNTISTDRNGVRPYTILGWVLPFFIVVPWIIVKYTTDNEFCWNYSSPQSYIWIINGPILATVMLNFAFFLNISRVLCLRVRSGERHMGSAYRRLAKFILVLVPLFGVFYILLTLVFPLAYADRFNTLHLYVEMTYNSFQGFLLALLFCFLNEEVLNTIKSVWRRRTLKRESGATRSFVLSSFRRGSRQSRGASLTINTCSQPLQASRQSRSDSATEITAAKRGWLARIKKRALACFGQDAYSKSQRQVSSSSNSSRTKQGFDISHSNYREEETLKCISAPDGHCLVDTYNCTYPYT